MAIFYPPLKDMLEFRDRPTKGEVRLLLFLDKYLKGQDDFEVFFQPNIEGYRPDVAILRRNYGLFLIEVKDYIMDVCYEVQDADNWFIHANGGIYRAASPITQLEGYKKVFYTLFAPNYAARVLENGKNVALVSWGVFLSETSDKRTAEISARCGLKRPLAENKYKYMWGRNGLNNAYFDAMLERCHMSGKASRYFDDSLYDDFKSLLYPPDELMHQKDFANVPLTKAQRRLAQSQENVRKKIRGAAGSGKTTALAARAYNAYLRTGGPVLILTFNITLRNYIRDMLSLQLPPDEKHRGRFIRDNFLILHYHAFINMYWQEYLGDRKRPAGSRDFTSPYWCIPEDLPEGKRRFGAILVDEAQDYEKPWIDSIYRVLASNGEISFWCDERQNIYQRALQSEKGEPGKRMYVGKIRGNWNLLKSISFRMSNNILELANAFQRSMLSQDYEFEPLEMRQTSLFDGEIMYYYMDSFDVKKIVSIYNAFMESHRSANIHVNDVAFLCDRVAELRWLDYELRRAPNNRRTHTVFEEEELFRKLLAIHAPECIQEYRYGVFKGWLENKAAHVMVPVRHAKRMRFQRNQGCIKLSTIHCFKGWEINVVFLLLVNAEGGDEGSMKNELVYTGMTRAKDYLVIINIGQQEYHRFFKWYMDSQYQGI